MHATKYLRTVASLDGGYAAVAFGMAACGWMNAALKGHHFWYV